MTYEAERAAIETKFTTEWAGRTPIAYENVEYLPVEGTAFVSLKIVPNTSDQVSLGSSPLFRHLSLINIGIAVPQGQGTAIANGHVDTAMAIFRSTPVFSGILCRAPYKMVVGEKEGWYQVNVIVPFQRDESY